MPTPEAPHNELNTWQQIADHLGKSVRTVQEWERRRGLPVRRLGGKGGSSQVVALKHEIDTWWQEHFVSRTVPTPKADPAQESVLKEATPVEIDSLHNRSVAGVEVPEVASNKLWQGDRRWIWLFRLGLLVGLAAVIHMLWPYTSQPYAFSIEGKNLVVTDQDGQVIWRHSFPSGFIQSYYDSDAERVRRWVVGDLRGDSHTEALFVHTPLNWGEVGSTLLCFSELGKVLWQFQPGRPVSYGGSQLAPPYFISYVQILPVPDRRGRWIVVTSNHHFSAPDQVAMLDSTGKLVGEYWHPGHLLAMTHADLNGDKVEKLLLGGVNNGFSQATLVVLDSRKITGVASEQGSGPRLYVSGLPPAQEEAIVLFPRTCFIRSGEHNIVHSVRVIGDRIMVSVLEGMNGVQYAGEIIYELDRQFHVVTITAGSQLEANHREREHQGIVGHHLSQELEQFRQQVQVLRR